MANEEHFKILRQGVDVWNEWRNAHPEIAPDLTGAHLAKAELENVNFRTVYLSGADLSGANLRNANLGPAGLSNVNFDGANLSGARLQESWLEGVNFNRVQLIGANLICATLDRASFSGTLIRAADFSRAYLRNADFRGVRVIGNPPGGRSEIGDSPLRPNFLGAILTGADFTDVDLSGINFTMSDLGRATLTGSNLSSVQLLKANLSGAILTGACIADWQIGSSTKLDDIICDYVYRAIDKDGQFSGRLPVDLNSNFSPGEFVLWASVRASALETIDLTFTEGFKWQDFFSSLQEVRLQNPDTGIFLQGVEERNGQYIVRLRIETDETGNDRTMLEAEIETTTKELVETKRKLHEAHGEIKALDRRLDHSLEKALRMATDQGPKYNLQGAQFAGGFAEIVQGNQIGGVINNYGSNADDIIRLLSSLSELSQTFPEAQQQQVQVHLEDLAADLKQSEKCSLARLKIRIASLFGVLIMLGGSIATATDFANNVLELSEKLNVPAEAFQPQLQQLKQIYPSFDWQG